MVQCQGPRGQTVRIFCSSRTFGRKMVRKSPKFQGFRAMYFCLLLTSIINKTHKVKYAKTQQGCCEVTGFGFSSRAVTRKAKVSTIQQNTNIRALLGKAGNPSHTIIWFSRRNHLLYHFSKASHLQSFTSPVFTRQNTFEKKN